jgi:hypothetical protein
VTDVDVTPILAIQGATIPWGHLRVDRVTILPARHVPQLLRTLRPVLDSERVAWLADRARLRFRPAA